MREPGALVRRGSRTAAGLESASVANRSGRLRKRRQRVDWPIIIGPDVPVPKVVDAAIRGRLATLLSAFHDLLAIEDSDAIARKAVELARERIGLLRVSIWLHDRSRNLMLGTWGSDLGGEIVDEHQFMYATGDPEREAFRRAVEEGAPFTVFEDSPIIEYPGGKTRVAGRGWVACTPIRSARMIIGVMFNDTGLSGAPVDETLDPLPRQPGLGGARRHDSPSRQLATAAAETLAKEPGIASKEMARRLSISLGRLTRVFKSEMGMSLVEYRNRLRLDRVDRLLDEGCANLLDAALAAGFGSYAQFHRVFRLVRGMSPRDYIRKKT
jgi:AraC-like DNA-binding protein